MHTDQSVTVTGDSKRIRLQAITQVVCTVLASICALVALFFWATNEFFSHYLHYVAGAFGLIAVICLVMSILSFKNAKDTRPVFTVHADELEMGNGIRVPFSNIEAVTIEKLTDAGRSVHTNIATRAMQPLADKAFASLMPSIFLVSALLTDGEGARAQAKAVAKDWKDYFTTERSGQVVLTVYLHDSLNKDQRRAVLESLMQRCGQHSIPVGG